MPRLNRPWQALQSLVLAEPVPPGALDRWGSLRYQDEVFRLTTYDCSVLMASTPKMFAIRKESKPLLQLALRC